MKSNYLRNLNWKGSLPQIEGYERIPHFVDFSLTEILQSEESSTQLPRNYKWPNTEWFASWTMRHWKETTISLSSSLCSFLNFWYPTFWGIRNWVDNSLFLRLKENKQHFPLCRFYRVSGSCNLRNLSMNWKPSLPQIECLQREFPTL